MKKAGFIILSLVAMVGCQAPKTPTAIAPVTDSQSPVTRKVLRDGQLLILRDGRTYTITGQQIQ